MRRTTRRTLVRMYSTVDSKMNDILIEVHNDTYPVDCYSVAKVQYQFTGNDQNSQCI